MFWEIHQQRLIKEAREQSARAESKAHAAAQAVEPLHAAERQIDRALLIQTALLELLRARRNHAMRLSCLFCGEPLTIAGV